MKKRSTINHYLVAVQEIVNIFIHKKQMNHMFTKHREPWKHKGMAIIFVFKFYHFRIKFFYAKFKTKKHEYKIIKKSDKISQT